MVQSEADGVSFPCGTLESQIFTLARSFPTLVDATKGIAHDVTCEAASDVMHGDGRGGDGAMMSDDGGRSEILQPIRPFAIRCEEKRRTVLAGTTVGP